MRYGWKAEKLSDHPAYCDVYIRPVGGDTEEDVLPSRVAAEDSGNGNENSKSNGPKKKKRATLVRCRYVGACDGANSFCSEAVGLKFDGLVNLANSRSTLMRSLRLLEHVSACHSHSSMFPIATTLIPMTQIIGNSQCLSFRQSCHRNLKIFLVYFSFLKICIALLFLQIEGQRDTR